MSPVTGGRSVDGSVVVPVRNAARTLGHQLEALADQDFDGSWEVVAVDNRSEDESRRSAESFTVVGISIPDFWLGTILILVFAAKLNWLPPTGYVKLTTSVVQNVRYMALPVLTLTLSFPLPPPQASVARIW